MKIHRICISEGGVWNLPPMDFIIFYKNNSHLKLCSKQTYKLTGQISFVVDNNKIKNLMFFPGRARLQPLIK